MEKDPNFSWARDVSAKELERKSVRPWEILLYTLLLAVMFAVSSTTIR